MKEGYLMQYKQLLIIFSCSFLLFGCAKNNEQPVEKEPQKNQITSMPLQMNKQYALYDKVNVHFKEIYVGDTIKPTNRNGEYTYLPADNGSYTMYDVIFYVENKSNQDIDISDYIYGLLDSKYYGYTYMETQDHKNINDDTILKSQTKSNLHLIFDIKKADIKTIEAENKNILVYINNDKYTLPFKEIKPKYTKLELEKETTADVLKLTPISSSVSKTIPPLNPNENSLFYICKDDNKKYAGMYIQIENTSDQKINVFDKIGVRIKQEGKGSDTWLVLLDADNANFVQTYEIEPHTTRSVLIFSEVELILGESQYTVTLNIDGKPYQYVYHHTNFE